jgi:hypothetical protein
MTFTDKQIKNFKAYERVRASGHFNMFDLRAQQAASLKRDDFTFVMEHYDALKNQPLFPPPPVRSPALSTAFIPKAIP